MSDTITVSRRILENNYRRVARQRDRLLATCKAVQATIAMSPQLKRQTAANGIGAELRQAIQAVEPES